ARAWHRLRTPPPPGRAAPSPAPPYRVDRPRAPAARAPPYRRDGRSEVQPGRGGLVRLRRRVPVAERVELGERGTGRADAVPPAQPPRRLLRSQRADLQPGQAPARPPPRP